MGTSAPATRRARQRAATVTEIKQTARGLLVRDGPEALTLRAIAREMGMTAPALYRYFASYEELVGALCLDLLDDLTASLERARDLVPSPDPMDRLVATCREFRRWALAHPREFQFVFAWIGPSRADGAPTGSAASAAPTGPAGLEQPEMDISFGRVFLDLFAELWAQRPFPVPSDAELSPALVSQLRAFAVQVGIELPAGLLATFISSWVRLYGAVTIEVFGHLGFALQDPEPMFEAILSELARTLRP